MTLPEDLRTAFADGDADRVIEAMRAAAGGNEPTQASADLALFEPRLSDRQGHFAILADQYLDLARGSGLRGVVYHHQNWTGESPAGWRRLFPVPDHLVGTDLTTSQPVMESYSSYFHEALSMGLRETGAVVAVFPTARFLTLPAIARAVSECATVRGAVIGIMETWPVPDCDDQALVSRAFREAARRLQACGKPVRVFAESEAIGQELLALGFSDESVRVAPYPAAARLAGKNKERTPRADPHFAALGASRPVHNPGLLAKYLLSGDRAAGAWTVRLNPGLAARHLDQSPATLVDDLRRSGVTVLPRHLDLTAYDEALQAADVMLLPYGERYQTLGSGIFLECVCAGVIPLVPVASTMRALYESLGGKAPAIETLTTAGLAECVHSCSQQWLELRENALSVRDAWLAHPQGPRQWRQHVSDLFAHVSSD